MEDTKQRILNMIDDYVSKFLYYDRKEDEDLPVGSIEIAISTGIVSVEEILLAFEAPLRRSVRSVKR